MGNLCNMAKNVGESIDVGFACYSIHLSINKICLN